MGKYVQSVTMEYDFFISYQSQYVWYLQEERMIFLPFCWLMIFCGTVAALLVVWKVRWNSRVEQQRTNQNIFGFLFVEYNNFCF